LLAALVASVAVFASAASGPRPLVTPGAAPAPPAAPNEVFEYVAHLNCGAQEDPKDMRLAKGFYATTINVHNPNREVTKFFKKLALTIPPGDQRPGPILPIANDSLEYDQALAVDCEDVARRLFGGSLPAPWIEGYIVIQSERSLDVTGVYSTATVRDGMAEEHSSIHLEQIRERAPRATPPPPGQPDLTVRDITNISVSCPGGGGTCVTKATVTIENLNPAAAGAFTVKSVFDPAQSVVVNTNFPGLAGSTPATFNVTTPPGGNCFDSDCTVCVTVDSANTVAESNEGNNQLCKTVIG
jgi:hypothetical protein